ncbi:MAG: biotin-dependent carboxyltransferase family protein [Hyphomonas sp.]|nr:biotin-dependent carboxyltransferase family protein [Hyphomonas sp.]
MALANRLVGNTPDACATEITYGNAEMRFETDTAVALAGAEVEADLSGRPAPMHRTLNAKRGEVLKLARPSQGVRTYVAVAGGIAGEPTFGSQSTFLPAGFGGHEGRALRAGDVLELPAARKGEILETPVPLRPHMSASHVLRCVPGPDGDMLTGAAWNEPSETSARLDRTGIELTGPWPQLQDAAQRPSEALFPGAVQLTPSGRAFLLLPDSQTTGGYPHVLQVIRADRHLLGQIGAGNRVRVLRRTPEEAAADLRAKSALFADWLPGFRF